MTPLRRRMLEDMAVLTGGQVVAAEVGLKLSEVGLDVLGSARRIVITKDTTTLVDAKYAVSIQASARACGSANPVR